MKQRIARPRMGFTWQREWRAPGENEPRVYITRYDRSNGSSR